MESTALLTLLLHLLLLHAACVWSATLTVTNKCSYMVWAGTLANAGSSPLLTGFELQQGASNPLTVPPPWSGRLWARTQCASDAAGKFTCATGDCGSGKIECSGAGAIPPVTLVEFTLASNGGLDFYDVSLVDGFNVPVSVNPQGGTGNCSVSSCPGNVNAVCPPELRVTGADGSTLACKSACLKFGDPKYCCTGEFGSPATCQPTSYSKIFKQACPRAYSYAYDDPSSTFTCKGADYAITFCP